jgi:hypothetical protein
MTRNASEWADAWDPEHPIRVRYAAGGPDGYIGIEDAVERLDFIDVDMGRADLTAGVGPFRSHMGSYYQRVNADGSAYVAAELEETPVMTTKKTTKKALTIHRTHVIRAGYRGPDYCERCGADVIWPVIESPCRPTRIPGF